MSTQAELVPKKLLVPFILITSLFALWGFANDITNPMVAAFKRVLELSNTQASWVQLAFYGGYFTMALPAAFFIKKYSYKTGVLLGLALYGLGACLFYPAAALESYGFFLAALYILTFGLAFLETTANPYILSMGSEETATQRLNLAQAFNPMGALAGLFVAKTFILNNLQSSAIKMPETKVEGDKVDFIPTVKRLVKNRNFVEGTLAQLVYVGAQIMVWTYIYQYAEALGISTYDAVNYAFASLGVFLIGRWICTFLLRVIPAARLLAWFAVLAMVFTLGAIFITGMVGLYSLVGVSFAMSLMFPTIYGIALEGLGEDSKFAAAFLVMAIVGGAIMPTLQGMILDLGGKGYTDLLILGVSEVNFSFILPWACFLLVFIFAKRARK
ncbi:MAG: MFS transporter [Algoriphagus sp.]|nr:MFS transporter [Algoriphagus sp.]